VNASDLKRPASTKLSGATVEMLVQPGKMLDKEEKRLKETISDLEDEITVLLPEQSERAMQLRGQQAEAERALDQAISASRVFRNWLTGRDLKGKTHLFILEDFAGSGQTAATDIRRLAIDYPSLKRIVFCPCVCTEQARQTILEVQANLPSDINVDISVLPGIEIPSSARAFSDDCYLWKQHTLPKTPIQMSSEIRRICDEAYSEYHHVENSPYAVEVDPIRITSGGYRDTQLLVVLYSNCPNNSLPIIWSTAKGKSREWQPLFERYPRY